MVDYSQVSDNGQLHIRISSGGHMTDIPDYTVYDNDDEVTQTPANFEEVHELLERLKEKKEEPQNLPTMEPEFQRPKLKLNNPGNNLQKIDRFKVHAFEEAGRLQQKQNNTAKKRPK